MARLFCRSSSVQAATSQVEGTVYGNDCLMHKYVTSESNEGQLIALKSGSYGNDIILHSVCCIEKRQSKHGDALFKIKCCLTR